MKICLRLFALAMLVAMPAMLVAPSTRAESTLDKILKEKKIRVAIDVGNPPFGILDKDGQPDGSDVAVARQMAKDMGVELEFVQVPSTGRIPALLSGRADVTIASISVTTDRAKAVMYCNPDGALSIVIFGPQSVAIKTPADLTGKRIGITRATLEEATVPKMAPPGTNIVWFDEIGATIQALLSGQVDAVAMTSFAGKTVADGNPDKKIENKLLVTTAYYAPIVRPGDFELRRWINTWIFVNTNNGTLATLYKKYTGIDLPPLPVF
ncbi:MAG: transporter substrate-binding domain-containing protein [Proteobacteria bacterium]|nr:transporter substrate-binding domain-containing protein [Pseudomonadota bacterium]MBI3497097.1 transporter substrate-binding domain-containing protein [Pseudomonadota bacterium]